MKKLFVTVLALVFVVCMPAIVFASCDVQPSGIDVSFIDTDYDEFLLYTKYCGGEIDITDDTENFDDVIANWLEALDGEKGAILEENARAAGELIAALGETFPKSRSGEIMFPDFFGGAGIDIYREGNPLVYVVESKSAEAMDVLSTVFGNTDFRVEYVRFSYSYLMDTVYMLDALFIGEDGDITEIARNVVKMWGHSTAENNVFITLAIDNPGNDAIVSLVENSSINPDVITFRFQCFENAWGVWVPEYQIWKNEEYLNVEVYENIQPRIPFFYLAPGAPIGTTSLNAHNHASTGFRARRNGVNGFVSAAHAFPTRNVDVWGTGGNRIGHVQDVVRQRYDVSFIETRRAPEFQVTISNRLPGVGGNYGSRVFEPEHMIHESLFMFGMNSPRERRESVREYRVRVVGLGIEMAIITSNNSNIRGGDSGGLVVSARPDANRDIAGIIIGGHHFGEPQVVVSMAGPIIRRLGLTLY